MTVRIIIVLLFSSSFLFAQNGIKSEIKSFRTTYKDNFKRHDYSPFYASHESLNDLRFFKAKAKYKVIAKIELTEKLAPIKMKTYSEKEKTFKQYAWAHFELDGQKYKLALYQMFGQGRLPQASDDLFVPFKDYSNSNKTYGGGRYMDLKKSSIDNGMIAIDFNKCYNPYCAFATGYNCPVPPIENHLATKITAGEKMYHGEKMKRPK